MSAFARDDGGVGAPDMPSGRRAADARRWAAAPPPGRASSVGLPNPPSAVGTSRGGEDRTANGGRAVHPAPAGPGRAASTPRTSDFCYDPWFWEAVDGFDFDVRLGADLGCGNGDRILQLLRRHPGARAMGIDTLRPALTTAATRVREAGLAHRAAFLQADARTLDHVPEFAEVDLLTCFLLGHEFWPRDRCVTTLRRLRELFPAARRFLVGDATGRAESADQDLPDFPPFLDPQQDPAAALLPTVTDWESVFEPGGWQLLRKYWINIEHGEVIFELEPL